MSDERKRFMFDFLADELYLIGEVYRDKPAEPPPTLQPGPITIRVWEGEPIDLQPVADAGASSATIATGDGVPLATVTLGSETVSAQDVDTMQPLMPAPLAEPGEITIPAPGRRQRGGYTRGLVRRLRGLAP